jgi:hypothetical protein
MKTYTCDYAVADPQTIVTRIEHTFPGAMVSWRDIDEDSFEVIVVASTPIEGLDDLMEPHLYTHPSDWDDCNCECGFDPYMGCYTDDC